MSEGDRLTNNLWSKYVEHGDYMVIDFDLANCSQCGAENVECQVLESETDASKPHINICVKCSGGS
jgi:hypothetical protein